MWKSGLLVLVFLFLSMSRTLAETEEAAENSAGATATTPLLIVNKALTASEIIIGETIKVTITITNVGRSPAFNVELDDETWGGANGKNSVQYQVTGVKTASLGKITPGGKATHSYSVTLTELGPVVLDPAKVTFTAEEGDSAKVFTAYSTRVNEGLEGQLIDKRSVVSVLTAAEYDRKYSAHVKEWIFFLILLGVPLGIPLYIYFLRTKELDALERDAKKRGGKK